MLLLVDVDVPVNVLLACSPSEFYALLQYSKSHRAKKGKKNQTWVWLCNSDDKNTPAAVLPTAAGDDMTAVAIAAGIRAAALAGASRHVPATAVPPTCTIILWNQYSSSLLWNCCDLHPASHSKKCSKNYTI